MASTILKVKKKGGKTSQNMILQIKRLELKIETKKQVGLKLSLQIQPSTLSPGQAFQKSQSGFNVSPWGEN
jgi:hypothetical protein